MKKVVIPAAGLGIRLLPATREQPKEMLPVFSELSDGTLCVKPFLQLVFERLYDAGFREFCFIVGRGKRSIEDHFTVDRSLDEYLSRNNKTELAQELRSFDEKVSDSDIIFVNQAAPKGFGNAVLQAKHFTGNEPFLVHAGDDLIVSRKNKFLKRMASTFESRPLDALLCVDEVEDPKNYGVVAGKKVDTDLYRVEKIEEKPLVPFSNLAIIAVYAFSAKIYDCIAKTEPDASNEIQLTNAIQRLVREGNAVYAINLKSGERRIDIGTAESYHKLLRSTKSLSSQ